jgi:hypothetical protein
MHDFQLRIPEWRNFGGFNEHGLEMFVPLFGNRPPLFLARRFPLGTAQATVTDGLTDRS